MATKQARGVTKAGIMDAGMELFMSKGAEVTVKDVAAAAGVSRQMVYQYFHTRSGLLTALTRLVDVRSGGRERFYKAMQTDVVGDRLDACVKVWLDYVRDIQVLANELNRNRRTDPDAESAYLDRVEDVQRWFTDLVGSLKADGALREDIQVADAIALTFAMLSPQIYELLRIDERWSHQRITRHLSEVVGRAVLN